MVNIKKFRDDINRKDVVEAVDKWNEQQQNTPVVEGLDYGVKTNPQSVEQPAETPVVENPGLGAMARYKSGQTSEAMPQSTNTTSEAQTTSPIDVKKLEEEVVANSANTFGTTAPKSGVDYLDSLYEELKPISKEEEERRLRGAASANTVAHLGNLLGALGGLYYTTKGAPAQKIADIKNPDYDAFSERVRKQREAHAGRLRDFDKWKQQMRIAEEELALKRAAQELDRQYKQGLIDKNELERRILALQEKFAPEKHEAELGRINAQTGSYNSSAYASRERGNYYSRGGSGSGSKNQPYEFSIDGKTYTVSKNRWNDANRGQLLTYAGSDGYVADGYEEYKDPETGVRTTREKKRRMNDDEALRYVINAMNMSDEEARKAGVDKKALKSYFDWLGGEGVSEEIVDFDPEESEEKEEKEY